jgi:hypothetical protein
MPWNYSPLEKNLMADPGIESGISWSVTKNVTTEQSDQGM